VKPIAPVEPVGRVEVVTPVPVKATMTSVEDRNRGDIELAGGDMLLGSSAASVA
jgi:hypothetical protein